jgi:hypothetical protein
MTYIEALQKERRWYKRVLIISIFHYKMKMKNRKWSLRHTAKRLQLSVGTISESLLLAKALNEWPQLEELSRENALLQLRRK